MPLSQFESYFECRWQDSQLTFPPKFCALPSFFFDSSPVNDPPSSLALPVSLSCKSQHFLGICQTKWSFLIRLEAPRLTVDHTWILISGGKQNKPQAEVACREGLPQGRVFSSRWNLDGYLMHAFVAERTRGAWNCIEPCFKIGRESLACLRVLKCKFSLHSQDRTQWWIG